MQLDAAIHLVSNSGHTETAKWLISLKDKVIPQQKQEWSKEGENNILFLTSIIEECFKDKEKITLYGNGVRASFTKEDVIDRLKSLKPQNMWKPSDREIGAILAAIGDERQKGSDVVKELQNIYQQLKKLSEE